MLGDLVYSASPCKAYKGAKLFPSPLSTSVLKMPGDTQALILWQFIPQKNINDRFVTLYPHCVVAGNTHKIILQDLSGTRRHQSRKCPRLNASSVNTMIRRKDSIPHHRDSCLCLKQVVSKACWKGQWGIAPRAGCGMSLLSQDAASMLQSMEHV